MPAEHHVIGHGELLLSRSNDGTLLLRLAGAWQLRGELPSPEVVEREIASLPPRRIAFDTSQLTAWDSGLLTFLLKVVELCRQRSVALDRAALPAGVLRLLALAEAVPERSGARQPTPTPSWLARIGSAFLEAREPVAEMLGFIGQITIAFGKLVRGTARYRRSDLLLLVQQAGADALGIITLISFLVGTILAFVGAVQLEQFGAAIYVADLVGIAMVREMGAMMTGIVIAGRTGAAFAAQLGTMKVTQETDALTTMGISPLEFLVLPRMLALCLMMPLLCLYADCVGILGGAAVGVGMLKLPLRVYYDQTALSVHLKDLLGGVFKASVYGVLIAISGCLRGMQCGNSSSAVGDAATSAVVTGIVFIISACGLFAVIFYVLGI
ncbi:MAG TPA: ABC transporter permease [Candidatus Kryptonia bacterium]|nr:ABC transporter permease [Candidatus Kryptonia bacterium]